jgi:hypothetical protein
MEIMIEIFVGALISALALIGYIEVRIGREMRPNHGSSMKDKLNKLETQVQMIIDHLLPK